MNLIFEIIFIALVVADTILTYKVLAKGGYREKKYWQINWPIKFKLPTLMGICIDHSAPVIAVTIAGTGIIMLLLAMADMVWLLGPVNLVFGFACWRSWRILHG